MSFKSSIYRTAPQAVNVAVLGDQLISAVIDINYVRLSLQGLQAFNNNIVFSSVRVAPKDTTHFTAFGGLQTRALVLVEEFLPSDFRQAFYYNVVDITTGNLTGTFNSGLTLGAKAFVLHVGETNGADPTLDSIDCVHGDLSLNVGTGVVTVTRRVADVSGFTFHVGFVIIDPR